MIKGRMIPDASALQAFAAAARHLSFTRAAVELGRTQSAVSRQIRDLEDQLGLRLFDRIRQRVVLSDAGRRMLPEAEALLDAAERMTLRAIGGRDIAGALVVAVLPGFGARWLVPRLPGFLARHPGVRVTLHTRAAPFDMEAEGVDLAIHHGQPAWPAGVCSYLCRDEIVPVAAAPAALSAVALLHLEARPRLWPDWLAAGGIAREGWAGHRFDDQALLIEAALAGLGAALLPRYLIETELAAGRLAVLDPRPVASAEAYWVVLPEGKAADPLGLAFRDWLGAQVSSAATEPLPPGAGGPKAGA
ncbi:LysR substrate-binding domain-containing protein [Frigidibacter sp. MR17.24]|uniref:LysR substrate-binding domain-containing protein n=1 Tax=Frigidibacter sp. MR17.24 TaxID=3127345 RepID=UPI003012ACDD